MIETGRYCISRSSTFHRWKRPGGVTDTAKIRSGSSLKNLSCQTRRIEGLLREMHSESPSKHISKLEQFTAPAVKPLSDETPVWV